MPQLDDVLFSSFGFSNFRPGQREVIEHLVAGRSAAAVFPTGAGKSLCYQLPALTFPGLTLVISPLIALMKDQIDALTARGIAAGRLDSTLSKEESFDVMDRIRAGKMKILYVAPERFTNERFREAIRQIPISLFAVDEAHCISEWGHNFRPDYLKLPMFAKACRAERVLALTATATPSVIKDICKGFAINSDNATCTGFYRPNLTCIFTHVTERNRDTYLVNNLRQKKPGPTIIYVTLQKTSETLAQFLNENGFETMAYHAGMDTPLRSEVQEWFLASSTGIVVATIAFGMGIDKANIRQVYHYNLPKSLENYSQEIGRAGRDGLPSHCEMIICQEDIKVLENFIYGDTPSFASIHNFVTFLFSEENVFDIALAELSKEHNIKTLVLRTLLTYLELEGYLEGGTPFFADYQFKFLRDQSYVIEKFSQERGVFLARLFQFAKKGRTWFSLNLENAAYALNSTRERIIRALDYLGQLGDLEVRAQGVRTRYRRLKTPDCLNRLAQDLHHQVKTRESRELTRIHQVLDLSDLNGCQVSSLCLYFGETLTQPCGHCSWCISKRMGSLT